MKDDIKPHWSEKPAPEIEKQIPPANVEPSAPDNEPVFRTPEVVAAEEERVELSPFTAPPKERITKHLHKLSLRWPLSRKEVIIASTIIVLIVSGIASWLLTHRAGAPVAAVTKHAPIKKVAPPKPTTVPSTLSGLPVDPNVNQRPVTGVMIENSLDARPQSGLSQASVVFEAIAEGGITRFLALFQDTQPENVGPIRSARPYYVQWTLGFDAGYAHVGGSPEALQNIKDWGARDLDQFYNSGSYHRVSSRIAPHNVYTSIAALNELETSKGYIGSTFTGFPRKKETKPGAPTAASINLAISGPTYNVHYDYDTVSNSYKRSEGGESHVDAETTTQLSPKVVVALVVPYSLESDGYHSNYAVLGSGTAYVFQDGAVTTTTWSKTDNKSQIIFKDATGKPVPFNPGQTWISVVSDSSKVTYN